MAVIFTVTAKDFFSDKPEVGKTTKATKVATPVPEAPVATDTEAPVPEVPALVVPALPVVEAP